MLAQPTLQVAQLNLPLAQFGFDADREVLDVAGRPHARRLAAVASSFERSTHLRRRPSDSTRAPRRERQQGPCRVQRQLARLDQAGSAGSSSVRRMRFVTLERSGRFSPPAPGASAELLAQALGAHPVPAAKGPSAARSRSAPIPPPVRRRSPPPPRAVAQALRDAVRAPPLARDQFEPRDGS